MGYDVGAKQPVGGTGGEGQKDKGGAAPVQNQVYIEIKKDWGDEWQRRDELIPVSGRRTVASMADDQLIFEYLYGPRVREPSVDDDLISVDPFFDISGWWVRLRQVLDQVPTTAFLGRVESPTRDVQGDQTSNSDDEKKAQGRQTWMAYGGTRVAERCPVDTSWWRREGEAAVELDRLPSFNARNDDAALEGNRSETTGTIDEGFFAFGGRELWSGWQIVSAYALDRYITSTMVDDLGDRTGPRFELVASAEIQDYLANQVFPKFSLEEARNMRAMLDQVFSNEFGLDYVLRPAVAAGDEAEDYFEVMPFSVFTEDMTIGNTTLPGNPVKNTLNISTFRDMEVQLEFAKQRRHDRVRVRGERVVSCFTLFPVNSQREYDGWKEETEDAYKAGSTKPNATAQDHDAARRAERFRSVYRRYQVPLDTWNFYNGAANPVFRPDGSFVTDAASGATPEELRRFQVAEIETLDWLPLALNVDYTEDPPIDNQVEGQEVEYRPPFAITEMFEGGEFQYIFVDEMGTYNEKYPTCSVRPLANTIGYEVQSSIGHIFAQDWTNAQPSEFNPNEDRLDKPDGTIAVMTDHRVSLEVAVPENPAGDGSVHVADVGQAEFWWLTGRTVVDVGPDGQIQRAPDGGMVVFDGRPLLEQLAVGVMARYLYERVRASMGYTQIIEPIDGDLGHTYQLEGEQGGTDAKAIVTTVEWDFQAITTRAMLGQATR